MSNVAQYRNLDLAFGKLLEALAPGWPVGDIQFVNELVGHAEYGEALENLVAIGRRGGKPFTPAQTRMIGDIAAMMGVPAGAGQAFPAAKSA